MKHTLPILICAPFCIGLMLLAVSIALVINLSDERFDR